MTLRQAEQFDQALEAMLDGRGAQPGEFRELLAVCTRLRDLPRPEFQASLGKTVQRRVSMTTTVPYRREGFQTVTPFLFVPQPGELLDFLEAAFGAHVTHRGPAPHEGFHGEARLGQAMLMVGGGQMALGREMRGALHYFVEDVDAAYQRAIAAGAKVMGEAGEPADRPYGERSAFVEDPFGNHWFLAKHLGPAGERTGEMTPYLYPRSARDLIAFLEKAFGAEALGVYEHEGRVMHAAVRLGDSLVEMGEAAPYTPQALSLYVEDPDAVYQRALAAGATPLWEPADQPYGERTSGVRDPFGNHWYPGRRLR